MSILLTALGIILVFALILSMAATVRARELRRNEEADRYRHYKECLWARDEAQQKADKYKDRKKAA
jgi:hypothetical protein